jgi:hypothetical protein
LIRLSHEQVLPLCVPVKLADQKWRMCPNTDAVEKAGCIVIVGKRASGGYRDRAFALSDMQFASMLPATFHPITSQRPFSGVGLQQCSLPAVHGFAPSSRPLQQSWQHVPSRGLIIAAADASVKVKLGMAAERLTLDLSECDLLEVPPGAFDIPGLEVVKGLDTGAPRVAVDA